jgi:hypothetical protein
MDSMASHFRKLIVTGIDSRFSQNDINDNIFFQFDAIGSSKKRIMIKQENCSRAARGVD